MFWAHLCGRLLETGSAADIHRALSNVESAGQGSRGLSQ